MDILLHMIENQRKQLETSFRHPKYSQSEDKADLVVEEI